MIILFVISKLLLVMWKMLTYSFGRGLVGLDFIGVA